MQTVIVTGVSGAGKTQAIDYLEDFGFFCIDNMPLKLLPKFLELCVEAGQPRVAVVVDIRSIAFNNDYSTFAELYKLKDDKNTSILFLEADDNSLVRRYQETRRRHPLSYTEGSLENSIQQERKLMKEMKNLASEIIDTSELKPAELYESLKELYDNTDAPKQMLLNIISFGFKYGAPRSADFVFDTRFLPNPFWIEELKTKTGEDTEVRDYVMQDRVAREFMKDIEDLIELVIPSYLKVDKTHITIAFGCTGGQHRSVTFAYLLGKIFEEKGFNVSIDHRDIKKDRMYH